MLQLVPGLDSEQSSKIVRVGNFIFLVRNRLLSGVEGWLVRMRRLNDAYDSS